MTGTVHSKDIQIKLLHIRHKNLKNVFDDGHCTIVLLIRLAPSPNMWVKLNLVDLNKQSKIYSQGMCPVYKVIPGKSNWERIRDRPTYIVSEVV